RSDPTCCVPPPRPSRCKTPGRALHLPQLIAQAYAYGLADLVALDGLPIETQSQAGFLRHQELPILHLWGLLEEPQRPGHVLDGEAVWKGGDEVHVDLRDEMADHRQVKGFGHAG